MARHSKKKQRTVIDIDQARTQYKTRHRHVDIVPKNLAQETYASYLNDPMAHIVMAVGPAGTGKTYLAVLKAIQDLKNDKIRKVVLTRPAVSVDEQHGFLPGDINAKMDPWCRPLLDVFEEYFTVKDIRGMMEENIIEISPLAYIRGRTFNDAFIIFDEAQNSTVSQTKAALTRLGRNARMVVTGDLDQHDRGYEVNGLGDFTQRLKDRDLQHIRVAEFARGDVERSAVVQEVLWVYGD